MNSKPALRSKTIVFNAATAFVLAVLEWQQVSIPDPVLYTALPLANILLRLATGAPISSERDEKEEKKDK